MQLTIPQLPAGVFDDRSHMSMTLRARDAASGGTSGRSALSCRSSPTWRLTAPPPEAAAEKVAAAEVFFSLENTPTNKCEVTSMAIALCLRHMHASGILPLHDERGVPIVAYGLQSADRVLPFVRHISLPNAYVQLDPIGEDR
ncbi:hypothetical protein AB1Y20_018828 [Prymnesium parvum]|uniref:Uncharacterized protein n=1 Tax=Prymnesium parvum TaxID=97485 RepID=A0AB34JQJ4_PRYPA